ncbi:hypothetical protein [Clostridium uliginosum]|uniref:Uncharacterized protein n=1 Tax=Clostridium uliginosum TaxID=119641 RepID=A0A1I1J0L2_9CLOT|nr:hypothetical protein [Clostridium uliginosum]SFC41671.1 hypothetical protein SAMN05421842_103131 [Clostridium uliginosum]
MNNNFKRDFINSILSITGNYLIMRPNYFGLAHNVIFEMKYKYKEDTKDLHEDPMYLLFITIVEDMQLNMNSLINTNEEADYFKYQDIKRNCRSIIEAYIDMLNLQFNPDYLQIIKLNCKSRDLDEEKINKILEPVKMKIKINNNIVPNNFININKKIDILNKYEVFDNEEKEFYQEKLIRYLNKYSHPNILIQKVEEIANINSIESTLSIVIECLDRAYILMIINIFKNEGFQKEIKNYVNKLDESIQICESKLKEWITAEKYLKQF